MDISVRSEVEHPRFAVVGGPTSELVEYVPETAEGIDKLRANHQDDFWCPTEFGGCGERMLPYAQRKHQDRRNYFRHQVSTDCPGADPVSVEHFLIQCEVVDWLRAQGHSAQIETTLKSGGRADVSVSTNFGTTESLEVQLSPQGDEEFEARTDRYLQDLRRVTWLYGPKLENSAQRAASHDGIAYLVDIKQDGSVYLAATDGTAGSLAYRPLEDFQYTAYGIVGPGASRILRIKKNAELRRRAARNDVLKAASPWLEHCKAVQDGQRHPIPADVAHVVRSDAVAGMAYRDTSSTDLGSVVVDEDLVLAHVGTCPLTGKRLFQSAHETASRWVYGDMLPYKTTLRVSTQATADTLTMPAGCYPLADGVSWFGVPDEHGFYNDVIHLFEEHLPRRIPLPWVGKREWFKMPSGSVVFEHASFQEAGPTKKGNRVRWQMMSGQIMHYPSWETLAVATQHRIYITLPLNTRPAESFPARFTLDTPLSMATKGPSEFKMFAASRVRPAPHPPRIDTLLQGHLELTPISDEDSPACRSHLHEEVLRDVVWAKMREAFHLSEATSSALWVQAEQLPAYLSIGGPRLGVPQMQHYTGW